MINVFGSSFDDSDIMAATKTMESQWVGPGSIVDNFEKQLSEFTNSNCILLNSGTAALELGIKELNLPIGSKVVLPSVAWNSCANVIVRNGLIPSFCDVDYYTCIPRLDQIIEVVSDETSAIFIIDYAGLAFDRNEIAELGLPIIEDAAHAVGGIYQDKKCGTLGDIGIYSFDYVKNVSSPDLGALISDNFDLIERVKKLRHSGLVKSSYSAKNDSSSWWVPNQVEFSPKYSPNDLSAAIAKSQFERLQELQGRRMHIWKQYELDISDVSQIELPTLDFGSDYVHGLFTFHIRVKNNLRDKLAHYLLKKGIFTTVRFYPLHLQEIYFDYLDKNSNFPESEKIAKNLLNLPLHPGLSDENIKTITSAINAFFNEN